MLNDVCRIIIFLTLGERRFQEKRTGQRVERRMKRRREEAMREEESNSASFRQFEPYKVIGLLLEPVDLEHSRMSYFIIKINKNFAFLA